MTPLTETRMHVAARELAEREPLFAAVIGRFGLPPLWDRPQGFGSLIHILLEQQVSLASARAAFDRLTAVAGPPVPETFLRLDDRQLREIGFSRQKTRYGRALATAIEDGSLALDRLAELDDDAVDRALRAIPGIGPWTASIYRLTALGRPDAWPAGDLAQAVAIADLWRLPAPPSPLETTQRAEAWRPWRAVATRLLWHHYLGTRRTTLIE
jgi:DNA-3-methyladenine glycosylase II